MAYQLVTKSGYNMFEMLSLLQKAIRRGEVERACFAGEECFDRYHSVLWNRLLCISCEDCWGIVTKEIVALRYLDEVTKAKENGNRSYVSWAITLLARTKKSRDACYFACNFVAQTYVTEPLKISQSFVDKNENEISSLTDEMFDIKNIGNKNFEVPKTLIQLSLFDENEYDENSAEYLGAILRKSIRTLDMENAGYALNKLREIDFSKIWKTLLASAIVDTKGVLVREIVALRKADEYVNAKKPLEKRDEIYVCKAMLNLMYYISGQFESVVSNDWISNEDLIDWVGKEYFKLEESRLPNGRIPEYVYDVHTIRGKRAGHTDWEMNIVEFAGLNPLQPSFFDNGNWVPRYEYKHLHGLCSEKEYQEMLEWKKRTDKFDNPVQKIKDTCC